jgi:DNA polymerase III epsilon subunit family exonuclease
VVVDVETTGTRVGAARLTEVGAVRVRDGRCLDTFARLVDPGHPLPSAITRLTGITAAMLQGAPPFARIAVEWLDFLGNGVLVAHNAPFDCSFLNHELIRCGEVPPTNPVLCSVRLARRLLPHLRSHSLDSLARHLGLQFRQRHRALGDAEVTAQVLLLLLQKASARGLTTLGELQKLLGSPVPKAHVGTEATLEALPLTVRRRTLAESGAWISLEIKARNRLLGRTAPWARPAATAARRTSLSLWVREALQFRALHAGADVLLDLGQPVHLPRLHKGDRIALLLQSCGPADAMNVVLRRVR